MITMAPNLPPVTLTDEAMKLCASLLAVAADPAGTQARLAELAAATAALRAAIDEHAGVVTQAAEVAAAQETVAARETAVAEREGALVSGQGSMLRVARLRAATLRSQRRKLRLTSGRAISILVSKHWSRGSSNIARRWRNR